MLVKRSPPPTLALTLTALAALSACGEATSIPVARDAAPQSTRLTVDEVAQATGEDPEKPCVATAVVNSDFSDAFVQRVADSKGEVLARIEEAVFLDGIEEPPLEVFPEEDMNAFQDAGFQEAYGQCILDKGADAGKCIEGSNTYDDAAEGGTEDCYPSDDGPSFEEDQGYTSRY